MDSEPSVPDEALVPRLLAGLVQCVCRFPWLVLAAAAALCGLSLYAAFTRLEYRTQRNDLISPHKDYQERWRNYVAEFGDDDDIVVVVEGSDRQRMEAALEAVAEKIREKPDLFDRLFYKVDLRHLRDRALLFLPTDSIRPIRDNLKSMTLLLELGPLGWRSLTLTNLLKEARHRAGQITPDEPLRPADEQFLAQLLAVTRAALAGLDGRHQNPWTSLVPGQFQQKDLLSEVRYFFSGDGRVAFLLARPAKDQSSFTAARASVDALRQLLAEVRPAFADVNLGLTGMPVLETDEMVASQSDTQTASCLALLGVALLYLVVYRTWRLPLLTVVTLLVGTIWALGWTTLTVGHLNILSATFAVMLIGMGDYGVLWVTRYQQERAAGDDIRAAMARTAGSVGAGILTAALSTALAFFAAMLADFQAVSELGWIAGSGILLCCLACFTVLPAMLCVVAAKPHSSPLSPCGRGVGGEGTDLTPCGAEWNPAGPEYATNPSLLPFRGMPVPVGPEFMPSANVARPPHPQPLSREGRGEKMRAARAYLILTTALVVTGVLAWFAARVSYDHNLLHLQAGGLESVRWEVKLLEHMTGASWHALSYTATPEEALALKAKYERLPEVGQVAEVASLVPGDQEVKLDLLRDIRHRLRNMPERGTPVPHARPSSRQVRAEADCLAGQLQPLAETSPVVPQLHRALNDLAKQLDRREAAPAEARLQAFEERLAADLADDLHRLRDAATPAPIAVADLPAELRERFIGQNGQWLLRVFAKDCLWDYRPLERFVSQVRGVDPEATGKPFSTLEGLRGMKNGFLWAGLYAFGAILLVLSLDFRHPGRVLLALAPLGMGLVCSLGVLGLCGLALNPANMIALPLILGVGVDNGVHVLHDYLTRRGSGQYTLSRTTGQGILVAALTTILGFGTLLISTHRGLAGLGFVLALGVAACMVSALLFLPAVLHLLDRSNRSQGSGVRSQESEGPGSSVKVEERRMAA